MPLILYRRHLKGCAVHKLGLPPRAVRLYSDCQCPIWIYGRTDSSIVPRQSTGYTDMAAAQALRASMDADAKDTAVHGPRLQECVNSYLASRAHEITEKTASHHALVLRRLVDYCAARGVFFAREMTVDLLESFKLAGLPAIADTTRHTATAKLRCFLKDALRRGWITEPLADRVRPYAATYETKAPYTDAEVEAIFSTTAGGNSRFASEPFTFRLLMELMLTTGMRVGDAVRYNPAVAVKGERLWVYRYTPQKSRRVRQAKPVEAYIPDSLKRAIDGCHWLSDLPFTWGSSFADPSNVAHKVYRQMKAIGAVCGIADCRPHRLRDTFAVRALLAGISLDDVSRLLGHSSVTVTEMHYAKWVPARGRRLESLVADSLMDTKGNGLGNGKRNVRPPSAAHAKAQHSRLTAKKSGNRSR